MAQRSKEHTCNDVQVGGEALLPTLKKHNMYERKHYIGDLTNPNSSFTRKGFWFHVDGALGAAYAPFLQMAFVNGYMKQKAPPVFDLISTRFCFFSCDKWAQVDRCPMALWYLHHKNQVSIASS